MTTPPKARKFRIRRNPGAEADATVSETSSSPAQPANSPQSAQTAQAQPAQPAQRPQQATAPAQPRQAPPAAPAAPNTAPKPPQSQKPTTEDGFGDRVFPGAAPSAQKQAQPAANLSVEQQIAAIRAEGLTGRQLRMARRAAQKNGLEPTSDFDAVRLLRQRGIDPFGGASNLELVPGGRQAPAAGGNTLPARAETAQVPAAAAQTAPAPMGPTPEEVRASEILKIQKDISQRRQRKLFQLAARLALFVFLPTLIVGYYFYVVATPLYSTHTEFVIQRADAASAVGAGGGGGGILGGGGGITTMQESITVQSYLQSREAMLLLDAEQGFRDHFSDEDIDVMTRLAPDATVEAMYDTYLSNLTISYDPTEGLVRMEVLAADPLVSQAFSEALIRYAEERVGQMSERLLEDAMVGAREVYEEAEERLEAARSRVLELQEQRGVLSADAEVDTVFNQISAFEMQLAEERLRLSEIQSAARPNPTRVSVAEANIARLESFIADLRAELTEETSGEVSLARVQSELVLAQADLETRQTMVADALQAMVAARTEANRQSLYISMGVYPVAPDEAAFPKAFENTLLALIVFAGVYLVLAMTASVLREQVSS